MLDSLGKNYLKILLLLYILHLNHGIIIRVSGVQVPPPLPIKLILIYNQVLKELGLVINVRFFKKCLRVCFVLIKKKCNDCSKDFYEADGKMVILPDEKKLIWHFYCKKCLRSWRKRGLENKGYSEDEINKIILREYP